jgi:hypothetical protein
MNGAVSRTVQTRRGGFPIITGVTPMKITCWFVMLFVLTVGCANPENGPPIKPPPGVDPLPTSSEAQVDRDAAWEDLQALLAEYYQVLPRQDVKELLVNAGGTSYSQRFAAELGDMGSWPTGGALYIYGWKGESSYYTIVVRTEGTNVDLNDGTSLLEKREFGIDQ